MTPDLKTLRALLDKGGVLTSARKEMHSRTHGLTLEESDKLKTWIDATLAEVERAGLSAVSIKALIDAAESGEKDTVRIEVMESLGMLAVVDCAKANVPHGYKFRSVREICDIARTSQMWTEEQMRNDPRVLWEQKEDLKRERDTLRATVSAQKAEIERLKEEMHRFGAFNYIRDLESDRDRLSAEKDALTAERDELKANVDSDSPVAACNCLTKSPEVQYHKPGCKYRLIAERDAAQRAIRAKDEALAAMPCKCSERNVYPITCPDCGGPLKAVLNPGWMNSDQFDSCKAGDYFCAKCKGEEGKSGHKYWWDRELPKTKTTCDRCNALALTPDSAREWVKRAPMQELCDAATEYTKLRHYQSFEACRKDQDRIEAILAEKLAQAVKELEAAR